MSTRKENAVTYDTVRRAAARFPGVEEGTSYGAPALKVRGKLLARLREDGTTLVLKCESIDREMLMQAAPDVFFVTDHYRDYPLVLIDLSKLSRKALPGLLEDAWRRLASRRQLAEHEGKGGA
ncbi:MmcQ/YjbR family DNA-binding protein [Luteimonas sp. SX5]|uniref:MmcQ/YjbR family DNA-binding protein n=1 Tax=Luteimonas galliterrae TaxID=2940486 RepID=A0ABT0MKZ9_9GAMM|nr:MmcQ/YjbR family DNA-binding protein [Luteimonas galliterrae]MCL1635263.1 MmcQ/YjbR family DNA-binding protein [Luteimonas galliterrae]